MKSGSYKRDWRGRSTPTTTFAHCSYQASKTPHNLGLITADAAA